MVPMKDIKRYCDDIAAAFKPRRIILFGSHAYGKPQADSDVDVLVVMPKSRRLSRHAEAEIQMKVRATFPVDMLVWKEDKVERRVRDQDTFATWITTNGKVMYEAVNA